MMEKLCSVMHGLKPTLLMIMVQITFAGVNLLYKLAVNDGMNLRIVVAYRFIFATAFIAPLAFFLERKKRAKMTWTILFQSFLCGLFGGALAQNFHLEAMSLTSVTFTSAMANLVPAVTFIMAVSLGMEKLNLRTKAGKAKIIGTVTGIGGAMVLTFVKGIEIKIGSFHFNFLHNQNGVGSHGPHATISTANTILGSICAMASTISYALWLIIHAKFSEMYPTHYSSTTLMLITVVYAGIVVSGVMIAVISWVVHMRGPLFASVFNPLMLVIVALASCTMLNEKLYLGTIFGAMLIVCGLYVVLWGKSEEMKKKNQLVPSKSSNKFGTVEIVVQDKNNHNNSNGQSQG
ncbi:hypothetical protein P8452_11333 [Trifolium repens]|nr:hypothetical protein P8452_11333 [Trifolium repens]